MSKYPTRKDIKSKKYKRGFCNCKRCREERYFSTTKKLSDNQIMEYLTTNKKEKENV